MGLAIHTIAIDTFLPMLRNLSNVLQKGAQYAARQGKDPAALMDSRLAPDMFPLITRVQLTCDKAKNAAARLAGQEPPSFEDNERTFEELRSRIARTIEYIEGIPAAAFAGAEERIVELPLENSKLLSVNGAQLLLDWMIPNFYFHLVIAYGILRHEGVDIGQRDYLSHAIRHIRQVE